MQNKSQTKRVGEGEERLDWSPELKMLCEVRTGEETIQMSGACWVDSGGLLLKLEILIHLSPKPSDRRQVVIYCRNYAARRHLSFCSLSQELMTPCELKMKKVLILFLSDGHTGERRKETQWFAGVIKQRPHSRGGTRCVWWRWYSIYSHIKSWYSVISPWQLLFLHLLPILLLSFYSEFFLLACL